MTKEYLKMADVFIVRLVEPSYFTVDPACVWDAMNDGVIPNEYASHAIWSHDELVEEVERLREFERDAMRYRFLRECHWNESPICVVVDPKMMVRLGADCPTTTRLDDAIDEMLA